MLKINSNVLSVEMVAPTQQLSVGRQKNYVFISSLGLGVSLVVEVATSGSVD